MTIHEEKQLGTKTIDVNTGPCLLSSVTHQIRAVQATQKNVVRGTTKLNFSDGTERSQDQRSPHILCCILPLAAWNCESVDDDSSAFVVSHGTFRVETLDGVATIVSPRA